MSERLPWTLRWRLSTLWFLEWGITGTFLIYLPLYLTHSGISPEEQGELMAVGAVGLWVAPLIVSQLVDRWLASEKYLAISHFVGGMTLLALPYAVQLYRETQASFAILLFLVGLYAVAYFPTVPVATSLSFRHLADPNSQFGKVRLAGTVGWILAGLGLSLWLGQADVLRWLSERAVTWKPYLNAWQHAVEQVRFPDSADCFRIAALLSFALSSFCIFLPRTPPARPAESAHRAVAPLAVLTMFRDRTFSLLIGITFLLSLVVPLYTLHVPKLLEQLGFGSDWVPAVMLIGQASEFPALLLLPWLLKRVGLKTIFAVGMGAWFIRYLFFSLEGPLWLILIGLALHGVCHVFLVIVIQLYVDSRCPRDLRASAQNLFTVITMGIGMPLGFLLGGKLGQLYYDEPLGRTDYRALFSVPAAAILVIMLVYCRWFRAPTMLRT